MTLTPSTHSRRPVEVAVLSDLHLGMRGCRPLEILQYLRSIDPEVLILNGDIIDVWQFKKKYFPPAHMQVLRELLNMIARKKTVYYITGNHDEVFRQFVGFETGNFKILNKLVLELDGKKVWFFHGDVFDVTMQHAKWLTLLGGKGYDGLIWFNHQINRLSLAMGKGRISLSKRVKNSVKSAVKFINKFEETAAEIAIRNGYEYVVCGHIHQPSKRRVKRDGGQVLYLNSGDWVENCTALEYNRGGWHIHWQDEVPDARKLETPLEVPVHASDLFKELLREFAVK